MLPYLIKYMRFSSGVIFFISSLVSFPEVDGVIAVGVTAAVDDAHVAGSKNFFNRSCCFTVLRPQRLSCSTEASLLASDSSVSPPISCSKQDVY